MMIALNLRDWPVVVVGAGPVAERKIAALLGAGARVTVIAIRATSVIEEWARAGRVRLEQRPYRAGDVRGARLAYIATGDAEVNRLARADADAAGTWLNVADEPTLCDFYAPAVVRRGRLTIAISTDGASPALAARLRAKLDRDLSPRYAELVDELADLRARVRREGGDLSTVRAEIDRLIDRVLLREDE